MTRHAPTYEAFQAVPEAVSAKDVEGAVDYGWDWRADDDPYLQPGEVILTADVTVDPPGELVIDSVQVISSEVVIAWVSGGVDGNAYTLRCKITTSATPPRTDARSLRFACAFL